MLSKSDSPRRLRPWSPLEKRSRHSWVRFHPQLSRRFLARVSALRSLVPEEEDPITSGWNVLPIFHRAIASYHIIGWATRRARLALFSPRPLSLSRSHMTKNVEPNRAIGPWYLSPEPSGRAPHPIQSPIGGKVQLDNFLAPFGRMRLSNAQI